MFSCFFQTKNLMIWTMVSVFTFNIFPDVGILLFSIFGGDRMVNHIKFNWFYSPLGDQCVFLVHKNMAASKRLGKEGKWRLGQTYENQCLIHDDFFFIRMISFIVQIVRIPNRFILFVWRCVTRLGFSLSYPLWTKVYYRGNYI